MRGSTIESIVEAALLLLTDSKLLLAHARVYRSPQSARGHQSNLAAAAHSSATYQLKVAQAARRDMKCVPALVRKQQSIIITREMPFSLDAG